MLTLPPSVRVYLASKPVDMRFGHDGLMSIVQSTWGHDPYSGHLFAFIGKRGDRIKLLYFDRGGFVLVYKRLEKGRFRLPTIEADALTIGLDGAELAMLLDGLDLREIKRPSRWTPPSIKGRIPERDRA